MKKMLFLSTAALVISITSTPVFASRTDDGDSPKPTTSSPKPYSEMTRTEILEARKARAARKEKAAEKRKALLEARKARAARKKAAEERKALLEARKARAARKAAKERKALLEARKARAARKAAMPDNHHYFQKLNTREKQGINEVLAEAIAFLNTLSLPITFPGMQQYYDEIPPLYYLIKTHANNQYISGNLNDDDHTFLSTLAGDISLANITLNSCDLLGENKTIDITMTNTHPNNRYMSFSGDRSKYKQIKIKIIFDGTRVKIEEKYLN